MATPRFTRANGTSEYVASIKFSHCLNGVGQAASLVRCSPGEDATNGFFVSCFIRDPAFSGKRKIDAIESEVEHTMDVSHKKKKKKRKRTSPNPTTDTVE